MDELACWLARGREFVCDSVRVLFAPYASVDKGARPSRGHLDGMRQDLGILRPLPRIASDRARAETGSLRIFIKLDGHLTKCSLPIPGPRFRNDCSARGSRRPRPRPSSRARFSHGADTADKSGRQRRRHRSSPCGPQRSREWLPCSRSACPYGPPSRPAPEGCLGARTSLMEAE